MNDKLDTSNGSEDVLQVKMNLTGRTLEMFIDLKTYFNVGFNSELIKIAIKYAYDNLILSSKSPNGTTRMTSL